MIFQKNIKSISLMVFLLTTLVSRSYCITCYVFSCSASGTPCSGPSLLTERVASNLQTCSGATPICKGMGTGTLSGNVITSISSASGQCASSCSPSISTVNGASTVVTCESSDSVSNYFNFTLFSALASILSALYFSKF